MRLHSLLRSAGLTDAPDAAAVDISAVDISAVDISAVDISAVHSDSRRVTPGALFVACDGLRTRGLDFVPAAARAGAAAIVIAADAELDLTGLDAATIERLAQIPIVRVDSPRQALGPLASASFDHPSHQLAVLAVTGTNGKTTTATLIAQLLCACGQRAAALGTLGLWTEAGVEPGGLTTPDAVDLQARLATLRDRGFTVVVLEASSHALDQARLLGTRLRVVGWTNLSRDHLDYHGDVASYTAAKLRLFTELLPRDGTGWVNSDDPAAALALGTPGVRGFSFGARPDADAQVAGLQLSAEGLALRLHLRDDPRPLDLRAPLLGRHNAQNLVLAALMCRDLGLEAEAIEAAARTLTAPPGRLQPVANGLGGLILVDYAHTPDALAQVLAVGHELLGAAGQLMVVFGCGGDRDAGKRAPMGHAAGAIADVSVATSDNPRTEDPAAILRPVTAGLLAAGARRVDRFVPSSTAQYPGDRIFCVEPDRDAAIRRAIGLVGPGDVLIIAGKGHETTQTIGGEARSFDDVAVAKRWLSQRKTRAAAPKAAATELAAFAFDANDAAAATGGTAVVSQAASAGESLTTTLSTDSRAVPTGALFVPLIGPQFDGHAYLAAAFASGAHGALCAAARRDVGLAALADHAAWLCEVPDTLIGLGDPARAHRRRFGGAVICITGSNGKTSTKELTALALGAAGPVLATYRNHNNRIGVPQTLARLRAAHQFAVVECGMSIPGEIAELGRIAEPDIAVLTNVSAAHLEGLGSVEGVAAEKTDLLRALGRGRDPASAVAIVPADEPLIEPHLAALTCRIVRVGDHPSADVCVVGEVSVSGLSQRFVADVCGQRVSVVLPAIGLHMVRNALTALAVADVLGVNLTAAAWALAQFSPVGQRMRPLQLGDTLVLEDCYNANPASVAVALSTLVGLPGPHVAVLGDMLELGERSARLHAASGAAAAAAGVSLLLARGTFAGDTIRGARQAGLTAAYVFTTDAEGAAQVLASGAATVLVKGSRGARMEGVIDALQAAASQPAQPPAPAAAPNVSTSQPGTADDPEADRVPVAL